MLCISDILYKYKDPPLHYVTEGYNKQTEKLQTTEPQ